MTTTLDHAALDDRLNQRILSGDFMGAFEDFYADDVVMQENNDPPCAGKAANRAREQAFVDSVAQVHAFKLLGSAARDDLSYSEWMMDVTFNGGKRVEAYQVAARRWKNGKVSSERFYYQKG
ncbi:MAG: nuclear transport factor 2 family protein [Planctomycetes bacterium]|nr:nuclear transport factor 2 family protein [Planctomycetota bacterium]